jgi:hypothetical protein
MKTIQGLAAVILVSTLALSGCVTTAEYNKRTEADNPKQTESSGPIAAAPTDPKLKYWTGVAQNQIGECLDQIGTVLDYEWLPFEDDPTAFGALYIQFKKTRLVLLAREWANGDDFVVPWTDKDSEILDSVKCFD